VPVIFRRQLRAPRQDGGIVAEPPLVQAGDLIASNEGRLARLDLDILGRPWADLSRQARRSMLAEAHDYLRRSGEPVPHPTPLPAAGEGREGARIIMAGHQPELFHPGVWVKNFAIQGLARRHGAAAVNLVVDNDTVKAAALRVPVLPSADSPWPYLATMAFDHWAGEVPYEEAPVRDEELFASFAERVQSAMAGCGFTPLLDALWPEVLLQARHSRLLGERLAAARRALERRWGCANLEVPVSRLCRTEPFAWFACHLLANLPRFHELYNACVHDYRRGHGIRSRNHPVPDLQAANGWLEVPFWGWRVGQQRRGRLMARPTPGGVELRAGDEPWPTLPLPPPSPSPRGRGGPGWEAAGTVAAWQDLERHGFKVRSRALTNTLYARLFLTDLFMHGIGGGKYDELTDDIIRRFYGFEPPGYLVLSATLLLPLPGYPATPEDCRRLARELRDLEYNPQRHLDAATLSEPAVWELTEMKRALVAQEPLKPRRRRERFHELRGLTEQLRPWVADRIRGLRDEVAVCEQQLRANGMLRRRDYAFCLYPEAALRPFCEQFLSLDEAR
jgi:hypothetical protein